MAYSDITRELAETLVHGIWPGKLTKEQVQELEDGVKRMEEKYLKIDEENAVGYGKEEGLGLKEGLTKYNEAVDQIIKTDTKPLASEVPYEATKAMVKVLTGSGSGGCRPAHTFLEEASSVMKQRAELRDTPEGERTAGKIAKVFNAITGHNISESDAWLFLLVMKIVRSRSGKFNADDYVDGAAYFGLLGEHESKGKI